MFVDDPADLSKEPDRLRFCPLPEVGAQGQCLQGRHAHALAVDRVERAQGIAHHQQAVGKSRQPFVAVSDTGWVPERDGFVERFSGTQAFVDVGELQAGGELRKPPGIGRRVVPEYPEQGDEETIVLHRREGSAARMVGCRRDEDSQLAVEHPRVKPVGPANVPETDLDPLRRRPWVAERLEPGRGA
jgi:hypothetical protein